MALALSAAPARTGLAGQRAAVIVGKGAGSEQVCVAEIAATLGTTVTKAPTRADFLRALQESDVVYMNVHISDSTGGIKCQDGLLLPQEVTGALRAAPGHRKLVVIVGCAAAEKGWPQVFSTAQVCICYNLSVVGRAGDVWFTFFFQAWKNGKTVGGALASADKIGSNMTFELLHAAMKRKYRAIGKSYRGADISVKNGMETLSKEANRVVQGDVTVKYAPQEPPPGPDGT